MAQEPVTVDVGLAIELQLTRRMVLAGSLSVLLSSCAVGAPRRESDFSAQLAAIQTRIGGRLGVHVLDTGSRSELGFNDADRFAMCSTFKLFLAAAVLARVDAGTLSLDRSIAFGPQDMLAHAPVTSTRLAEGAMSVRELCTAVVEVSDNPAANLLLALIGGPDGLTRFLRTLGDDVTRLDRKELELNTNLAGDPRDTSTPRVMARTTQKLLIGQVLSDSSRTQLISWLLNCRTGLQRIRAGLPADWKAGDKTGTGANGAVNDVLIAWPPDRDPIIAVVFMSESKLPTRTLGEAHAQIGRLIADTMRRG